MTRRIQQRGRGDLGRKRDEQLRLEIAQEAARILVSEHSSNFLSAKQKAAARLGVRDTRSLPRNDEVEAALRSYQSLFHAESQAQLLAKLRSIALDAMSFFHRFEPRLVGPVLSGTAMLGSAVNLHIFSDSAEDIAILLMDNGIPYHMASSRLVIGNSSTVEFPVYCFLVDDVPIEVVVFPQKHVREPPRTVVGGELIERASRNTVQMLMLDSPVSQEKS